jgi:hypothetical protein
MTNSGGLTNNTANANQTNLVQAVISMLDCAVYNGLFDVMDYVWFVVEQDVYIHSYNKSPAISVHGCYWLGTLDIDNEQSRDKPTTEGIERV